MIESIKNIWILLVVRKMFLINIFTRLKGDENANITMCNNFNMIDFYRLW